MKYLLGSYHSGQYERLNRLVNLFCQEESLFRENKKNSIRLPDLDSDQKIIFFVFYIMLLFIILKQNETVRNSMNFYDDKTFYSFEKCKTI